MSSADETQDEKGDCMDSPRRWELLFRRWVLMLSCAVLLGCSSGSKIDKVIVRGSVTLDGQPIPNGEIRFYPIEGTIGSVSGGPIKDGQYVAKGRGGVPVGKCRVELRAYRPPSGSPKGKIAPGMEEGRPAVQYLPAKYNTRSELTATIESGSGSITKDFNLSVE